MKLDPGPLPHCGARGDLLVAPAQAGAQFRNQEKKDGLG
jgi:hypothetical protein